jgi:TRAP-type uncharacterized transport system substrate-binding protein
MDTGMKTELPRPSLVEKSLAPSPAVMTNRKQAVLFVVLTLLLTIATVWGARVWFTHSEALVFATGEAGGVEAGFANKLAAVLKSNNSRLRLKIVSNADSAKALAQFDRRQADLAILRTDARVPQRARAIAVLEHDVVLLISPGSKKIGSLAALKKRKIAVLGNNDKDIALVRNILEIPENADGASRVAQAPPNSTLDKLLGAGGYGAVVAIMHTSKIIKDKSYEQYARRGAGFVLNPIDEAKALARKNPGLSEETLEAGMLSSAPAIPSDDLSTLGLEWLLVAQSRLQIGTAVELARTIYENKAALALPDGFASKIEPADTDKDAFVVAHRGAAGYINDDTKSFMERYSDMMYLGTAVLGVIGSIFAGIYTKLTRVAPERASQLATEILDIGQRIEHAGSLDALEALQEELEAVLRGAVVGLRDGTISSDGLDTFRLGYEFVRDEIAMRRESLKRHGGNDDNLVVVKSAHGA